MDDVGEKQKKRRESEGRGDTNAPKISKQMKRPWLFWFFVVVLGLLLGLIAHAV